jgi:predicted RNA-binding protein
MCEIAMYRGAKKEANRFMEDVFGYEIDFKAKNLTAYDILGENKRFKFDYVDRIQWSADDNSLVVEGNLERIDVGSG